MTTTGRKALITGITGQDGSYLAEFLLDLGYQVYGIVRRCSHGPFERIQHILDKLTILDADMLDQNSLDAAVKTSKPDEIYNLAAQSYVATAFKEPILTSEVTAFGTLRLLESMRKYAPEARFYQASSSEMFGKVKETPQDENTPFYPRSPYGVAKVYAHHITINYRDAYKLFAVSGICFNHESPRRGLEFLSRKVSHGVAQIKKGSLQKLKLGNLEAKRDWGYAGDYVKAMWKMLQLDEPKDFVLATGKTYKVQDLVEFAFSCVNLDWRDYVEIDESLYRPSEVDLLIGNPHKAFNELDWYVTTTFDQLVEMMVKNDLKNITVSAAPGQPTTISPLSSRP